MEGVIHKSGEVKYIVHPHCDTANIFKYQSNQIYHLTRNYYLYNFWNQNINAIGSPSIIVYLIATKIDGHLSGILYSHEDNISKQSVPTMKTYGVLI